MLQGAVVQVGTGDNPTERWRAQFMLQGQLGAVVQVGTGDSPTERWCRYWGATSPHSQRWRKFMESSILSSKTNSLELSS
jgi:hypothetical protein